MNGIAEDKQASVLLTVIGMKNYGIIKSLVAPAQPKDKSYVSLELVATLKEHFQPKPLIIAERFRFYQRNQEAGESVLEYVAALRRLAITCEFGDFLDQALRDRFVCGMKLESTQKKLLAERDLTLARAQELARGMEVAAQDTRDMRHLAVGADKIHHTDTSGASGSGNSTPAGSCHRCGKSDHDGRACKFRQAKCYKCGKTGHIAPVCRSTGNHKGQREAGKPGMVGTGTGTGTGMCNRKSHTPKQNNGIAH